MTYYERIQRDKVFCASMLSAALNGGDYQSDDYDPAVMEMLDKQAPASEGEGAE